MKKSWVEVSEEPYMYYCTVLKDKKQIVFGEGSVMPFVTQKIHLEEFLYEHTYRFSDDKRIEIANYVNS